MAKNRIATCYFPTTTLFLDDGVNFLKDLSLQLDEALAYRLFYEPYKALRFLKDNYHPYVNPRQWLSDLKNRGDLGDLEKDEFTHSFVDIDIFSIHKMIYIPDRFSEISVAVIDYAMPAMNGLVFCAGTSDLPIKKIILTGQAGHSTAVRAFNEKLIDRFIMKGEYGFLKTLHDAIHDFQRDYFSDLSDIIIKNLEANPRSCLGDPIFLAFFDKFKTDHHIIEYYLVKESGCFLMLDEKNKMHWLIVKAEADMQEFTEIAEGNDASRSIVDALKQREKLLFLFTKEDEVNISVDKWKDYLFPVKKLAGQFNDYYYAVTDGPSKYDVYPDKIHFYKDHLKKM